jgi:hypothetical protein
LASVSDVPVAVYRDHQMKHTMRLKLSFDQTADIYPAAMLVFLQHEIKK